MAEFTFQDFRFEEKEEILRVHFLKIHYFDLPKEELEKIGAFQTKDRSITFDAPEKKAEKLFMRLINKSMTNLTNKLSGNPTLYIHQNSGIPLVGSMSFGIVDKGSDMLEVKPLTSCNADCIFCSVDEGPSSKKKRDIVIEKDYLVKEIKALLDYKKEPMHIYINPQGEPLLYLDILDLIKDLSKLKLVKATTIITNGMLLTKELADGLIEAGLTSFNVSFHAMDERAAKELFHTKGYRVEKIKEVLEYVKDRVKVIIAPVLLKGLNEEEVERIIPYAKEHGFELGIQNFLHNKKGRNPVKEQDFDEFFALLKGWEKKYDVELIGKGEIKKTKQLKKPFQKDDIIEVEFISEGRYPAEWIAQAQGRIVTITGKRSKKVKITRDTYNIFFANPLL
jgi:hypothetical protein